jgi:hypothetical protein
MERVIVVGAYLGRKARFTKRRRVGGTGCGGTGCGGTGGLPGIGIGGIPGIGSDGGSAGGLGIWHWIIALQY